MLRPEIAESNIQNMIEVYFPDELFDHQTLNNIVQHAHMTLGEKGFKASFDLGFQVMGDINRAKLFSDTKRNALCSMFALLECIKTGLAGFMARKDLLTGMEILVGQGTHCELSNDERVFFYHFASRALLKYNQY